MSLHPLQPTRCTSPLWSGVRPMTARELSDRLCCERVRDAEEDRDELARRRAARAQRTPSEGEAA